MKIFAGFQLCGRKPSTAPVKIAARTAILCCCNKKLMIVMKRPAIPTTPVASPSIPSIQFTVFIIPTVQNQVSRTAGIAARLILGWISGEGGWINKKSVGCKYHGKFALAISLPKGKGLLKVKSNIP